LALSFHPQNFRKNHLSVPLGYSSLQPEGKACTLEMSLAPPCARKFVCLYVVSEIFLMIKNEKEKKKNLRKISYTQLLHSQPGKNLKRKQISCLMFISI